MFSFPFLREASDVVTLLTVRLHLLWCLLLNIQGKVSKINHSTPKLLARINVIEVKQSHRMAEVGRNL